MKKFIPLLLCIASCQTKGQSIYLKLDGKLDSCYLLNDSANRLVEIVENTLSDTIILGFSIIPPKFLGKNTYLRLETRRDFAFYPDTPTEQLPKTKTLCVSSYNMKKANGYLLIRFKK